MYPLEQLTKKILMTRNIGEDVEQVELSYIISKNVKWYSHFGK